MRKKAKKKDVERIKKLVTLNMFFREVKTYKQLQNSLKEYAEKEGTACGYSKAGKSVPTIIWVDKFYGDCKFKLSLKEIKSLKDDPYAYIDFLNFKKNKNK